MQIESIESATKCLRLCSGRDRVAAPGTWAPAKVWAHFAHYVRHLHVCSVTQRISTPTHNLSSLQWFRAYFNMQTQVECWTCTPSISMWMVCRCLPACDLIIWDLCRSIQVTIVSRLQYFWGINEFVTCFISAGGMLLRNNNIVYGNL